jgi:hypothetical protein
LIREYLEKIQRSTDYFRHRSKPGMKRDCTPPADCGLFYGNKLSQVAPRQVRRRRPHQPENLFGPREIDMLQKKDIRTLLAYCRGPLAKSVD